MMSRAAKGHHRRIYGGGAGLGAILGGKKGALIGGLVGGTAGAVYDRKTRKRIRRE